MHRHTFRFLIVLAGTLISSACTDTVYREIPQYQGTYPAGGNVQYPYYDPTQAGTGPQSVQSNMTTGEGVTTSPVLTGTNQMTGQNQPAATTTPAGTTNTALYEDSTQIPQPTGTGSLADGGVSGVAGQSVDCQNTVPCQWISSDRQFTVSVTNADNIASRGRLSVKFSVSAMHDTQLVIGSVDEAVDSGFNRTRVADMILAEGNGNTPVSMLSGGTVTGTVNFSESITTNSLSNFSIAILDNGMIRKATMMNLPVGPVTSDFAQCNYTLPCIWASPDQQVIITLLSVGGYTGNGRLNANFQVLGAQDMTVAMDAGATAIGDEGTRFSGRTHALATVNGYDKVTAEAIANIPISGSVDFYRTDSRPNSLVTLSIVLFEDSPAPRWNPRFDSVPVL
ncbi:MAG: hypothetical protein HKN42_03345 [Granulosicoccus sp.]|nr:hypothetical protein [Granulosicoccus sp.]